jgi:GTPase SAR1 family protein
MCLPFEKNKTKQIPIILVGNKLDLEEERAVTSEQGRALAQKFGTGFLEASAKTNTNVSEIFFELVRMINKWRENNPKEAPAPAKGSKGGKKSGCTLL